MGTPMMAMLLWCVGCCSATFVLPATTMKHAHRKEPLLHTAAHCSDAQLSGARACLIEAAMRKGSKKRSSGSTNGGFGGARELQSEVKTLRSQLADAQRLVDELGAENDRLRASVDTAAPSVPRSKRVRGLRKVSSTPLVFTIDDFVDADMCAKLLQSSGSATGQLQLERGGPAAASSQRAQLDFATLVAGELFAGQWGANDGLRFNAASSSDANNDGSARLSYPDGIHVDTNNGATYRSVTCILYLNDVAAQCGGGTIFPLARVSEADPGLAAARKLLGTDCTHTRSSVAPAQIDVAALLEAACAEESLLRIQPEAGTLCIFFTRTADGEVDPRSWHGGERIRAPATAGEDPAIVAQKHILTLFKEVSYLPFRSWRADEQSFESYLAPQIAEQRRYLEDLAESHAPFFVD